MTRETYKIDRKKKKKKIGEILLVLAKILFLRSF